MTILEMLLSRGRPQEPVVESVTRAVSLIRRQLNIGPRELAYKVGCSPTLIYRVESGDYNHCIEPKVLEALAALADSQGLQKSSQFLLAEAKVNRAQQASRGGRPTRGSRR